MNKIVTFLVYCMSVHLSLYSVNIQVPLDQIKAKADMKFSNGMTYQQFEDELRSKHPEMPDSLIVSGHGLETETLRHKIVNPMYASNYYPIKYPALQSDGSVVTKEMPGHYLFVPERLTDLTPDQARFIMTHEIGHSQYPNMIPAINVSQFTVYALVAYYWQKMIGSAPYRNRCTKYGSKLIAGDFLSTLAKSAFYNLEERRADNFAIKHADAATLQGGVDLFKGCKAAQAQEYAEQYMSNILPFNIGWKLFNPVHPSPDSRIAKIEQALKSRYGIDTQS